MTDARAIVGGVPSVELDGQADPAIADPRGSDRLDELAATTPVLDPDETVVYLRLPSRRALQRLVDGRKLAPMTYTTEHRFHRDELDRFLREQLALERQVRGIEADR